MLHAHTDGNSSAIGGHGGLRVVFPPPHPLLLPCSMLIFCLYNVVHCIFDTQIILD